MKLAKGEAPQRVDIKLNRNIKRFGVNGVMFFGDKNDYPQLIENIILGSTTAKAVANIYAKFLSGEGFSDAINKIVIGKDQFGADVTVMQLLGEVCTDCSRFHGSYIHSNINRDFQIGNVKRVPFKHGRLAKPDDVGYFAKIGVYDNWSKEKGLKYDEKAITFYNVFNPNREVFIEQLKSVGGDISKYAGQIYPLFLDSSYIYPLSPFDSVYLDADSESQLSLFRNRQLRNGMAKKTIFRVKPEPVFDESGVAAIDKVTMMPLYKVDSALVSQIKEFLGPNGDSVIVIEDDFQPDGNLGKERNKMTEQLDSSIDDTVFAGWEQTLSNNVRKAANGLPAILIDYEQGKLSGTSGEAISQATAFYNAITRQQREVIGQTFKNIFSRSANVVLSSNQDWTIKELKLIDNVATPIVSTATGN